MTESIKIHYITVYMWYLPDKYKIGSPGIPQSTFNFDAHVMRLLPLLKFAPKTTGVFGAYPTHVK